MQDDLVSIIIPAHNEEAVIDRCLDTLLRHAPEGRCEILVVCNGCSDRTAEVASRFEPTVQVLQCPVASKVAALNMGDQAARGYPRLYIDADVMLPWPSIQAIVDALHSGPYLAASPAMRMDFSRANALVKAYYNIWCRLPYTREGMMGTGVYALSKEGRRRFENFPDVIADDGYVRMLFTRAERTRIPQATSTVTAPATLRDLIRIKTRSRLGYYQLHQRFPDLAKREKIEKQYGGAVNVIARRPLLWPAVVPYLWVNLLSRWRAKQHLSSLNSYVWERDESSR